MAMLVLVFANADRAAEVGANAAPELAALGVTTVSVLRDEQTTALVLDGWAFDAGRSADAVVRIVTDDPSGVQVLRPVLESAVHPSSSRRSKGRSAR